MNGLMNFIGEVASAILNSYTYTAEEKQQIIAVRNLMVRHGKSDAVDALNKVIADFDRATTTTPTHTSTRSRYEYISDLKQLLIKAGAVVVVSNVFKNEIFSINGVHFRVTDTNNGWVVMIGHNRYDLDDVERIKDLKGIAIAIDRNGSITSVDKINCEYLTRTTVCKMVSVKDIIERCIRANK